MSNPVIEQVRNYVGMEENDIGEFPDEDLYTHAAQAALRTLVENWEVAMGDGTKLRDMVGGDIDALVERLGDIKRDLVQGLGARLDEEHPRAGGPTP